MTVINRDDFTMAVVSLVAVPGCRPMAENKHNYVQMRHYRDTKTLPWESQGS